MPLQAQNNGVRVAVCRSTVIAFIYVDNLIINLQVLHNDRVARWQLAFFPTAPLNKENYITGQKINIFYTWALCALSSAQQFWFVLCIVVIFLYFILYCIWQGRQSFFFALKRKQKSGRGSSQSYSIIEFEKWYRKAFSGWPPLPVHWRLFLFYLLFYFSCNYLDWFTFDSSCWYLKNQTNLNSD